MKKFFTTIGILVSIFFATSLIGTLVFGVVQLDVLSKYAGKMSRDASNLRTELSEIKYEVYSIRTELLGVKQHTSETNTKIAGIGKDISSTLEKITSLEQKAQIFQEETEPLFPIPEGLLDEINRAQAEDAKQKGQNQTAPPESNPFDELFDGIPDEPPTIPEQLPEPSPPPQFLRVDRTQI